MGAVLNIKSLYDQVWKMPGHDYLMVVASHWQPWLPGCYDDPRRITMPKTKITTPKKVKYRPILTLPPLPPNQYEALRDNIAVNGVLVPIITDSDGPVRKIIDGNIRKAIANELGYQCPEIVQAGLEEDEKRTLARALNLARRQLDHDQKRQLIADQLREAPERTNRWVRKMLGVHHTTVGSVRQELESVGEISQQERRVGNDGKQYKSTKAKDYWGERLAGVKRNADNPLDFHPTPEHVTEALIARERFRGQILEPASGNGAIVRVLRKAGYTVTGKDITGGTDFLKSRKAVANIVTNPPYSDGMPEKFCRQALALAKSKVAMLLPLWFLEGIQRHDLFAGHPLKAIYVFSRRHNLKLNTSSSAFVKRDIRSLPLTDAEFEADFFLDPKYSTKRQERWVGSVIQREDGAVLAVEEVPLPPPTVNSLANLLAHAMLRPRFGDRQRPRIIHLRDRPQWQDVLPHLRQLGIEVVLDNDLPRFDQAVVEWMQKAKKSSSADEIEAALRKPFPKRKRTWFTDAMALMQWSDAMSKGAYPSRKTPAPLYDPTTTVSIHLAADELELILTRTDIANTKKLRPRLEAMAPEGKNTELNITDWSCVVLALCGAKGDKQWGHKQLLQLAARIANQLAEALGIDPPSFSVK